MTTFVKLTDPDSDGSMLINVAHIAAVVGHKELPDASILLLTGEDAVPVKESVPRVSILIAQALTLDRMAVLTIRGTGRLCPVRMDAILAIEDLPVENGAPGSRVYLTSGMSLEVDENEPAIRMLIVTGAV